jgi:predicted metal-dependent phosphoesterase TrpH
VLVDLHLHSRSSDGVLTAEEYAAAILARDVAIAVICDHDRIGESVRLAALLPERAAVGIEIACLYQYGNADLLGLGLKAPAVFYDPERTERYDRLAFELAAAAIRRCGFILPSFQRPYMPDGGHPTRVLGDLVWAEPRNRGRLLAEGVNSANDFKLAYLAKGAPASFSEELAFIGGLPTVPEAIEQVHRAGGLAVLAHPGLLRAPNTSALIKEWAQAGLDGLETDHPAHDAADRTGFERLAAELDLLASYGSDSHEDLGHFAHPARPWSPARVADWRSRLGIVVD